jgi:kinetochore protein Spc7/SPC105
MLEDKTGWSIVSALPSGSTRGPLLTMTYRDELQVKIALNELKHRGSDASRPVIELSCHPKDERTPQLSPVKSFILTKLRRNATNEALRLKGLREFIVSISKEWDLVYPLEEEIRLLEFNGVTKVAISQSENNASLRARCIVIGTNIIHTRKPPSPRRKSKLSVQPASQAETPEQVQGQQARIDIDFTLDTPLVSPSISSKDLNPKVSIAVSKVYGFTDDSDDEHGSDHFKDVETDLSETQMQELIREAMNMPTAVSDAEYSVTNLCVLGRGIWSRAVEALVGRVF